MFIFRFDVLLHPRLFCLVINTADTCKYATNDTNTSCTMDDHVEQSREGEHVRAKRSDAVKLGSNYELQKQQL